MTSLAIENTEKTNSIKLKTNTLYENYDGYDDNKLKKVIMSISYKGTEIKSDTEINIDNIFDNRLMPSLFLLNEINESIINSNHEKFLFYSLISLSGKEWNDLHPEHLKLILDGYLIYKDGSLFRDLILEIFKSYKFII